ncbi:hypothetical protein C1H46_034619 [Malus baccata]|uniref:Uncharacterized protein n=1 Tax=Malus baccata TaxID=106549 RepID=A0A540L0J0_MALBA|nr:hypothetical protein C1H46_034619 [Malus baccata]
MSTITKPIHLFSFLPSLEHPFIYTFTLTSTTKYLVVANEGNYHLSFISLPQPFSHPLILV